MDRYVVAGNPVEHSQSPFIHAEFAKATGQAMSYSMSPLPGDPRHAAFIDALEAFFQRFSDKGLLIQPTTCWISSCRFAS